MEQNNWEPKIVAFLCNWCSYAGADLAGTSRLQYPPSIRIIRVPCSGRINPIYIINALLDGADGVLVSGCHPGDCHYLTGNMYARRRFTVLKKLLTTVGIDPERVQFTWVSASEGNRFAEVITDVTENVRNLGPIDDGTGIRLPLSVGDAALGVPPEKMITGGHKRNKRWNKTTGNRK
jgi:coenzyme F420-reducing hydrogenase delta subunit